MVAKSMARSKIIFGLDAFIQSSILSVTAVVSLCAWVSLTSYGYIDLVATAALGLILFIFYTLDRALAPPEDVFQPAGGLNPGAFVGHHHRFFRKALIVAVLLLAFLIGLRPKLLFDLIGAVAVVLFYMVPVPGLAGRIKDIPYFKHVYAPLSLVAFTIIFFGIDPRQPGHCGALCGLVGLAQINTWAFDLKDIEGDRRAGIRLLAGVVPPRTYLALLACEALLLAPVFFAVVPPSGKLGAVAAAIGNAVILLVLRHRFSLRVLFYGLDAIAIVPLAIALLFRSRS